jgi:ketosteroid isomerase-like protein
VSERDEIVEVLARYARALEDRDADAVAELFAPDGNFELFSKDGSGEYVSGPVVAGREHIRAMVGGGSLPPGRGMHYLTSDHIVEITGDEASLRAQFLAVESSGDVPSGDKWTAGASVLTGSYALTMVGRYESQLRKAGGRWQFTVHRVKHNLPMAARLSQ